MVDYDFAQLPHAGIRKLSPYVPGKSINEVAREQGITDIIKIASNENAWGCSPNVLQAIQQLTAQTISLYPQSINHSLRDNLAHFLNIEPNMLALSNGSDFIFGLLLQCFALHNDKHIITHDYAFSTYEIQANTLGIPVVKTPTHDWEVDVEAIIQACNEKTALVFIANPNNPTGVLIEPEKIKRLIESIPKTTILVLDEAYYEYARAQYRADSLALLNQHPNLVITRTFSKAYGLAGLRLGYAIATPQIIRLLYHIQLPFVVNIVAMIAAEAALSDQDFIHHTVAQTKEGLNNMQNGLNDLGLEYLPSSANFITINCQTSGKKIFEQLQKDGIIVRPLDAYQMDNYIRVTIGTAEQNTRFLKQLKRIIT